MENQSPLVSAESGRFLAQRRDYVHKDTDIQAQRDAYKKMAKLKLRYINHPGKTALLGLTTWPSLFEVNNSTNVSKALVCSAHRHPPYLD